MHAFSHQSLDLVCRAISVRSFSHCQHVQHVHWTTDYHPPHEAKISRQAEMRLTIWLQASTLDLTLLQVIISPKIGIRFSAFCIAPNSSEAQLLCTLAPRRPKLKQATRPHPTSDCVFNGVD